MLNSLRNVTFIKAMMWIVAFAFVGLIVFEWGADFSGRSGDGPVGDAVGSINGRKISYQEFEEALRNAYQQAKTEQNPEPELAPLIRHTWDRLVAQTLFAQQIEKLDISVSDQEVNFINRVQPVEWVKGQEVFQTEGSFDPAKYSQFLDDPGTYSDPQRKQFVLGAEFAARQALLSQKLQEMIAGSVRVTTSEVRQAYVDENEKVKVEYAGIESRSIEDSLVSVSDDEIQSYYVEHKDEYNQAAAVKAAFVTFSKTPSEQDKADTESEIRTLLEEVRGGEDFARLARNNSDDPGSARKGGDLGFFKRGQMVKAFEDTAFSLEPGQISEPFQTRFGWHILKVESRKGASDSLQVRARHILLKIDAGRNTLDGLRLQAEEFRDRAIEDGFDVVAQQMDLKPQESGFITAGGFFPLLQNRTAGLVNNFLNSSEGTLSNTIETDQGIYIFSLVAKRDEGPQPLEEVHTRILTKLKTDKKVELAASRMEPVLSDVEGGQTMKNASESRGLEYKVSKPINRTGFLPGVGGRNAFVSTAFQLEPDQLSKVVKTDRGAYILRVIEREAVDETGFQTAADALTQKLLGQKRNETFSAWFTDLRGNSDIIDNRHRFYSNF